MHRGGQRGDRQRVAAGVRDVRAGGAQRVVDAEEVDGDGALEDRGVAADERQLGGDPGVGDDDVEPAELPDDLLDGPVDLLAVATSHSARRARAVADTRSSSSGSSPTSATRAPARAGAARRRRRCRAPRR